MEYLEQAAAQEEPEAMRMLARSLWSTRSRDDDVEREAKMRARHLWHESALLGWAESQEQFAVECCARDSPEQMVWFRRASHNPGRFNLIWGYMHEAAARQLTLFDKGGCGKALFELGIAFTTVKKQEPRSKAKPRGRQADGKLIKANQNGGSGRKKKFVEDADQEEEVEQVDEEEEKTKVADRVVSLFNNWQSAAKRGVMCWLWLSRELGVMKDIRLVVADLVWADRAAGSEKAK